MLMKRIGKMKQKKGAVLFAVIAVMALLIAMASTAYYTARSAYNSVVSNYNYSQLYLSAISVADMVTESVSNNHVVGADAGNDYTALRNAIYTLESPGASISAYSTNITNPSATEQAIINELGNKNSIVAGALDGVVVKIELVDNTQPMPVSPNPYVYADGRECWWFKYVYRFTTTAYYRNNVITVEDVVVTSKSKIYTPGSGTPPTPPTDPTDPIIIPVRNPQDPPPFTTFFTSTGQVLNPSNPSDPIDNTERTVIITVHTINDNAYFENEHTFFKDRNGPNKFVGGIQSTGSVYLELFNTDIPRKDLNADPPVSNDWFIGDDLVISSANSNNLDLKNNNLYVGRDLVLSGDNATITAEDIYVEGDLYILNKAQINGNLHVSGNIYYQMGDTNSEGESSAAVNSKTEGGKELASTDYAEVRDWNNGWTVTGNLDLNGTVVFPDSTDATSQPVNIGGSNVNITDGYSASTSGDDKVGTFNPTEIQVDVVVQTENEDEDTFDKGTVSTDVSSAISSMTSKQPHYNYTAEDFVYENELTIDFSELQNNPVENGEGQIDYYEFQVQASNGETITIKSDSNDLANGNITVSIPYNVEWHWETDENGEEYKVMDEGGYFIDIPKDGFGAFSNATIRYEFETKSDEEGGMSMPIVLKDNITTEAGDPGFSWQGEKYDDYSLASQVVAMGDGNVTLETASMDKDGNYSKYNAEKFDEMSSVVYVVGQKEAVGNEQQVQDLGRDPNLNNVVNNWYDSGAKPKDEYQNQFALISNVNNGAAVDAERQLNAFCGYVYAPNGDFLNEAGSGASPVYGGMIVSTYASELSNLYYAEPTPSLIDSLFEGMDFQMPGDGDDEYGEIIIPGMPGTPGTPGTPPPPGNWSDPIPADYWNVEGSNFVG